MNSLEDIKHCDDPLQELKDNSSDCTLEDSDFYKLDKYAFNDYFKDYDGKFIMLARRHKEVEEVEEEVKFQMFDGQVQRMIIIRTVVQQGKVPHFMQHNHTMNKVRNREQLPPPRKLGHLFGRAIYNLGLVFDLLDSPLPPCRHSADLEGFAKIFHD